MRSIFLLFIMELNPCPLLHQWLSYLYIKVTWWAGYKADTWARLPEIQFCGSEAQPRNLHIDTTRPHPQVALVQCMVVHTLRNKAPNPLRHVLKKTLTKGKLITPVSTLQLHVHCTCFCCWVQDISPSPRGHWHYWPNWNKYGSCHHSYELPHPAPRPPGSFADFLLQVWLRVKVTWPAELAAGALSVVQTFKVLPRAWAAGLWISYINALLQAQGLQGAPEILGFPQKPAEHSPHCTPERRGEEKGMRWGVCVRVYVLGEGYGEWYG